MLDLRLVMENLQDVRSSLARRGAGYGEDLDRVKRLGDRRLQLISKLESLQRERNQASQAMAQVADKKGAEFGQRRESLRELGERIKVLESEQRALLLELDHALSGLPNVPFEQVPEGRGEADNPVLRTWGDKPRFESDPLDHVALGERLRIVDLERGARISGARFAVLTGLGARLERALINFMLDLHTEQHGYTEVWPPALVKAESLFGTGQLPKFGDDVFSIAHEFTEDENRDLQLYLSPTAEVQLTNLHRGEILEADQLPLRYVAYCPCFRAEAGSHGRDTRGLIRLHQFDKVELVHIVAPSQGLDAHEELTKHAEAVLKGLNLHYRVVELCTGDLGFTARRTYDLEVWLPGQAAYREISSCSWVGDFQARRTKIRYREAGKPQLVHTLNGSGLAVGRTLVAILEQYQQPDGSVRVPDALVGYMGGVTNIPPC